MSELRPLVQLQSKRIAMSLTSAILAVIVVLVGAAQYALCIQSLRDLVRRSRVRGNTKSLWALLILCLPIAGAMIYNWMGPTSFVDRRMPRSIERQERARREAPTTLPDFPNTPANITPIGSARSARLRRSQSPLTTPGGTQSRAPRWTAPTDTTGS